MAPTTSNDISRFVVSRVLNVVNEGIKDIASLREYLSSSTSLAMELLLFAMNLPNGFLEPVAGNPAITVELDDGGERFLDIDDVGGVRVVCMDVVVAWLCNIGVSEGSKRGSCSAGVTRRVDTI
jgi:hypothetical protein